MIFRFFDFSINRFRRGGHRTALLFPAVLLSLPLLAAPATFTPKIELKISPAETWVTCPADAEISFLLPFELRSAPTIAASFIPQNARLSLDRSAVKVNGTNCVRYATHVKLPADAPGVRTLGPVSVGLPSGRPRRRDPFFGPMFDDDDFFGGFFGARNRVTFRSNTATYTVREPPQEGRPATDIGAISADFAVKAALDASVCTAGDPLVLTVAVSGTMDFSRVRPPVPPSSPMFRPDPASLKSDVDGNVKRFTWRVRALKAGTGEFPSCTVSWFDPSSGTWRTTETAPIPVQVQAGAQATLGAGAEAELASDAMPMPDGLDLDFPAGDFTLEHALSLAVRASDEKAFAAAAAVYAQYLGIAPEAMTWDVRFLAPYTAATRVAARHRMNLAALLTLAGKPADALVQWRHAEWLAGATPSSTRGVKAALARLRNDPRAELALPRQFLPFFYRLPVLMRAVAGAGAFALLGLVLWLVGRSGRRTGTFLFAAACAGVALGAPSGTVALEPAAVAVGQPAAIVFTFKTDSASETVESMRFAGLPDPSEGLEYGEIETLAPNRFRLPVRFVAPYSGTLNVVAQGMLTHTVRRAGFVSSSSHNFAVRLAPYAVSVQPLPTAGRPADFTGAIGSGFRLASVARPASVHPGDLVTLTYTLDFTGYCPTGAVPTVTRSARDFRVYPLKEVSRTPNRIVWTQIVVPQSVAATNAATLAFSHYAMAEKAYRTATVAATPLAFVSAQAASTQNTSVLVNAGTGGTAGAKGRTAAIVLRFAPHAASPVVATLPGDTPKVELGTYRGWRRVAAGGAVGWLKEPQGIQ